VISVADHELAALWPQIKGERVKAKIHINQHIIKANDKTGERNPVITVKTYKSNEYAHSIEIKGFSTIIYSPDKPLNCGAKVWIETNYNDLLIH
tara:strand:+ start:110 stop:391 length:282 start_codon:yes stop_codon:yes gene_type:complete